MSLTFDSTVTLNNGIEMPQLGFGTWKLKGKAAVRSVQWALDAGYRHIDTAKLYGNETEIGDVLMENEIRREDLFLTSKVWDSDQGYKSTLKAFEKSLGRLRTHYLDLYLIHWPRKKRMETWRALETLLEGGKVKAIGVANFYIHHLEELMENFEITPAVNQFELNPFLYREDLIQFCRENDIAVQAYSPLAQGKKLNDPTVKKVADTHDKSAAQVLIRWALQHGFIVIPRSGDKDHIEQNANVFDFSLDEGEMEKLDSLNEGYHLLYDTSKWD